MCLSITYPSRSFELFLFLFHDVSTLLHHWFPFLRLLPPPVTPIKFACIGRVWRLGLDGLYSYPSPINHLVVLSLLSPSFFLLWHTTNTILAHPAVHYTASPHSSTILTIFYILYRRSLQALHILLFSELWFRTVQNVDASFLYAVPMLSLLCSFPLFSLISCPTFCAECTFIPLYFSSLHSMVLLIKIRVSSHVPPSFLFSLILSQMGTLPGDCSTGFFSFHRFSAFVPPS